MGDPMACEHALSRRRFLKLAAAGGLGAYPALSAVAEAADAGPLAPRPGHFSARAKHLVFIFLTGGMSHVDTFDPKPRLRADHGKKLDAGFAAGSPFHFARCGKSGIEVSELFPAVGSVIDECCVIRSLHTDITEHFQATLAMHTGSATVPMPSIGSWISHGLGTLNPNLPSFVALCANMPYAGAQVWDNSFLPAYHQGVRIIPGDEPIPNLRPPAEHATLAELARTMLRDVNAEHRQRCPGDTRLGARMNSFEVAAGMMRAAPEAFRLEDESEATLHLYGPARGERKSFAAQCLTARRLLERGVRVIELIDTGSGDNWDAHGDMQTSVPKARAVDQPIAGLICDLRQRGILDETLVAICTEFGRTPTVGAAGAKGREHHGVAFSCLLAGAGVRGGTTYGRTDDYGEKIVEDPVHVHDYHATILHLLGLDHTKLTYRYAGRDFRLTDVDGNVIRRILA
jgi:hypothetical protein